MAFTDFKSIQQVQKKYNIAYIEENYLKCNKLMPSDIFLQEYKFNRENFDVFASETTRCENIIYPILRDIYKHHLHQYALWSHKRLTYDQVLTGIPDYLITSKSKLGKTVLGSPILIVIEAKQNNFTAGWGQCLAELYAAQQLNNNAMQVVHGIVTDGDVWHFGKLLGSQFIKHPDTMVLSHLEQLFGAIDCLL